MDITSLLFVSQFADNPTEKIGDTLKRFDISSLMAAIDKIPGAGNTPLEQLTASFSKLNDKGQEKAASYVEDLTKIPEYKKTEWRRILRFKPF